LYKACFVFFHPARTRDFVTLPDERGRKHSSRYDRRYILAVTRWGGFTGPDGLFGLQPPPEGCKGLDGQLLGARLGVDGSLGQRGGDG
jgi:hypothetical protein